MNPQHYRIILQRELKKLKEEIEQYPSEEAMWKVPAGIHNSAANLAIHLVGNLNYYVGEVLGKTGYERQKEQEFTRKDYNRAQILEAIDQVMVMVQKVLDDLAEEVLVGIYPAEVEGQTYPTELILHHTMAHFAYHLGQINYHRRLTETTS